MSGAASTASLHELHRKLAEQLGKTLDRDIEDEMPTDAATLSVISNFLKNNSITCDPADKDTTSALQEKFKEQARMRDERKNKALELVRKTGTEE
ncbi:terminase small subunit [Ralstonia phage RSB3]|uniref:Putative DNA maturase A n=1 Tax=Ralstonia phage RSB3 TaxID=1402875 RepID=U3TIZ8_9CAUD|nr:terminase small subunit [Ralstonia phage RSB3]BAN92356.1 putative DNA maturase A [Ralstonia phage RSB3]